MNCSRRPSSCRAANFKLAERPNRLPGVIVPVGITCSKTWQIFLW